MITTADVANLEFDKITSPQLAVEPQIKQGQLPGSMFDLQSHADVSQVSSGSGPTEVSIACPIPDISAGGPTVS